MSKGYCNVCGLATSTGITGTIYYCPHKNDPANKSEANTGGKSDE